MSHPFSLALIALLSLHPLAHADEIYKWVDNEGRTHYGEGKRPRGAVRVQVANDEPSEAEYQAARARAQREIKAARELEKREQKERAAREKASAQQEKRAAQARAQQERDAALIASCQAQGHNYCDSADHIRAVERRRHRR
jgi:hypothetical protein